MRNRYKITKKALNDLMNYCCDVLTIKKIHLEITFDPDKEDYGGISERMARNGCLVRTLSMNFSNREMWLSPVLTVFWACRRFYIHDCLNEYARREFFSSIDKTEIDRRNVKLDSFVHVEELNRNNEGPELMYYEDLEYIDAEVFAHYLLGYHYGFMLMDYEGDMDFNACEDLRSYFAKQIFNHKEFAHKVGDLGTKYNIDQYKERFQYNLDQNMKKNQRKWSAPHVT